MQEIKDTIEEKPKRKLPDPEKTIKRSSPQPTSDFRRDTPENGTHYTESTPTGSLMPPIQHSGTSQTPPSR